MKLLRYCAKDLLPSEPKFTPRKGRNGRANKTGSTMADTTVEGAEGTRRRDRNDRGEGPEITQEYQYEERPPEREPVEQVQLPPAPPMAPEAAEKVKIEYASINGTLEAKVFDSSWNEIARMPVNELVTKISENSGAKHLVFDGIVTQRLIDAGAKVGIETIVGHRAGEIQNKPDGILVYSFRDLGLE